MGERHPSASTPPACPSPPSCVRSAGGGEAARAPWPGTGPPHSPTASCSPCWWGPARAQPRPSTWPEKLPGHGPAQPGRAVPVGSNASTASAGRRRRGSWRARAGRPAGLGGPTGRRRLPHPDESARYLLPRYGARPVETFGLLALDVRHRLKRGVVVSVGCLTRASSIHGRCSRRRSSLRAAASSSSTTIPPATPSLRRGRRGTRRGFDTPA